MNRRGQRGVTLIEMVVVVAIIAVMTAIMFPSATSGIDSIRLASAADSVSAFLAGAVNIADRRQVMVELTVARPENALYIRYAPSYEKRFVLPDGITVTGIFPEVPIDPNMPRRFVLYPGGAPPRVGVRIGNSRGGQRIVSLDPVTGTSIIEKVPDAR
jgi:prepilin-type N-terminal cleavage/methylation domain-containing protein